MIDLSTVSLIDLIMFFGFYLGKMFLIACISFYVLRCVVGLFVGSTMRRKTKTVEYEDYEEVYDPYTKTYKKKWYTDTKEVIDKDAETPEFLEEYQRQKILGKIRASRVTAFLVFGVMLVLVLYHGNYLGFQNFLMSDKELESIAEAYQDFAN